VSPYVETICERVIRGRTALDEPLGQMQFAV